MHYTFFSDDPSLNRLDIDHGASGLLAERLMFSRAYLNPNDPLHSRAMRDVQSHFEVMHGVAPAAGYSGGAMVFSSKSGEVLNPFAPQAEQQP